MLSKVIQPPDRKKFLAVKRQEDWLNPFLKLNTDGGLILSTSSQGTKNITAPELKDLLTSLPVADWPFGRVVAVQPASARSTDKEQFQKEDKAIKDAWGRMRNTLGELEVQTNLWPSAD